MFPTVPPETLPCETAPLAAAVQPLEEESVHRMFKARERATVVGHSKVVEVAAHLARYLVNALKCKQLRSIYHSL